MPNLMFDREEPPLYWAPGKHGKPKLNTMKKLLCLAAAATIAAGAMAQGTGLKFGAKAGLNVSKNFILTDLSIEHLPKSKVGFNLGGMMNYGFGRRGNLSVLVELLYDQKGAKVWDVINDDGDEDYVNGNLSYLTVPIQARYRFKFGLYLEGGPYIGALLGASRDGETEYDWIDDNGDETKRKYREDLKGSDFGFALGLGYIHDAGWGVGYRGYLGLRNIDNPEGNDPYNGYSYYAYNRCGSLSFMYFFGWDD